MQIFSQKNYKNLLFFTKSGIFRAFCLWDSVESPPSRSRFFLLLLSEVLLPEIQKTLPLISKRKSPIK